MEELCDQKTGNFVEVSASASGEIATSGMIVINYDGYRQHIPAVIFSESEIDRLFRCIDMHTTTNGKLRSRKNGFTLDSIKKKFFKF